MIPRAYPQVPVRAKLTIAPYVVLLVVVLGVLEDQGVIELAATTPTTTTRPPREAGASPGRAARAEIPAAYLAVYWQAARTCPRLSWTLLAAVGKVESNHGRGWPPRWRRTPGIAPGTENYAGAGGPMQFLAPTWARGAAAPTAGTTAMRSRPPPGSCAPTASAMATSAPRCTPTTPPAPTPLACWPRPAATRPGVAADGPLRSPAPAPAQRR